jgi:hypothetical protein
VAVRKPTLRHTIGIVDVEAVHAVVDALVEFHALLLETSELTQPRLAAWIGIRLRLNEASGAERAFGLLSKFA